MLPRSAWREIRKRQEQLRALRAAQYAKIEEKNQDLSTPARRKRKRSAITEPPSPKQTSRQEALSLWRRDQKGSYEVSTLERLSVLRQQYDAMQSTLSTPVRKTNRFEFKERRYRQGIPLSNAEASRRAVARALSDEKEKKREARRLASKAHRSRMSKINAWLSPRRCLASLLNVNLCCGPGDCVESSGADLAVESGSDVSAILDDESSDNGAANTTIFTADDIFTARSRVLEIVDVRNWILQQCNNAVGPSFKFGGLLLCESCFCVLHNIKVYFFRLFILQLWLTCHS